MTSIPYRVLSINNRFYVFSTFDNFRFPFRSWSCDYLSEPLETSLGCPGTSLGSLMSESKKFSYHSYFSYVESYFPRAICIYFCVWCHLWCVSVFNRTISILPVYRGSGMLYRIAK